MYFKRMYGKIEKVPTACCALGQLRLSNMSSIFDIENTLSALKIESTGMNFVGTPTDFGGQKAVFVITTPDEEPLERRLKFCGFKHTFTFDRRMGYAGGRLKMWTKNL